MVFFGGSGKKEDTKQQPPAPQASTNYAPPGAKKADPAPPANGGADDLFGGMTQPVARRRGKTGKGRKGDDIDDTASVISEAKSSEHTSGNKGGSVDPDLESNAESTTDKKPFTAAKFSFGGDDAGGSGGFEVEDAETQQLRSRLEKFYAQYNPTKLSKLDDTIKAYKGKETKLFASLVEKYGPEPGGDVAVKVKDVDASGWGSTSNASVSKKDGEATTGGWGASAGDAWGSTDDTAAKAGDGEGFNGGSGGFGDAAEGGGGFGFDSEDKGAEATGGFCFGDESTDKPASGGFGFDDSKPDVASEDATGGDTWGSSAPVADSTGAGGFGFDDAPAAESGGFGFDTEDKKEESPEAAAVMSKQDAASDSEESDEEDIPLWEQHRREISSAASYLTEKQSDVAKVVNDLAEGISSRHERQKQANQYEAAMDAAVASDDYEEAGRLDEELQSVKAEITATDGRCDTLPGSIAEEEEGLESAFLDLASLAEQQGQSLKNNLADEERKVDKYITETTSRVGQSADKVAADLEKATRTMNNVQQEVVNLQQRRAKVVEKNEIATAGHRKSRDELASGKKQVEEEIRELEQTLAQKRRLLAEKKMELGDVEGKLTVIMRDHEENLVDVDEQMSEEQKKLDKAQASVNSLTSQEEKVDREKADLTVEAERLNTQLANQREKMHTSADVAESIRQRGLVALQDYYKSTLGEVLAKRQQGKGFLCATPSSFPELAKITNALSALEVEVQQESATLSTATVRLKEISKALPALEAAKKSAALAKQFKEASAKTAEIKALNDEKVSVESELAASSEKSSVLSQSQADLLAQKRVEEKLIAKQMEGFVLGYYAILKAAMATAPSGTGVQKWVDTISCDAESHTQDVFADATINLLKVLDDECRATPVKLDRAGDASASVSAYNSPVQAKSDDFPANGSAEVVEEEEEVQKVTDAGVISEEEVEVVVEEKAAAPTKTRAEIEKEIAKYEEDIESAMQVDDYDQCELCQNVIDGLKEQLEGMDDA